ncbi:hypothetical protein VM1G_04521 [Cytospora mali]|uniref:Uncharacterized protein n=1 Tax=Cytospora mali TaxID=578113 RepID=A0A194VZ47_CYTMA|nr:hypothetical protein VM1G_04521 [Valsa mali]
MMGEVVSVLHELGDGVRHVVRDAGSYIPGASIIPEIFRAVTIPKFIQAAMAPEGKEKKGEKKNPPEIGNVFRVGEDYLAGCEDNHETPASYFRIDGDTALDVGTACGLRMASPADG